MSDLKKIGIIIILFLQVIAIILLQVRIDMLEAKIESMIPTVQSVVRNQATTAKALKNITDFECYQQKLNAIVHHKIEGNSPHYQPLPIPEDCK